MNSKWKANGFYNEAIQYVDKVVDTDEVLSKDMSKLFYEELELMIKQGEQIKIEVKAKPGEGKSTIGLALAMNKGS